MHPRQDASALQTGVGDENQERDYAILNHSFQRIYKKHAHPQVTASYFLNLPVLFLRSYHATVSNHLLLDKHLSCLETNNSG
jgi:hypothetical protein